MPTIEECKNFGDGKTNFLTPKTVEVREVTEKTLNNLKKWVHELHFSDGHITSHIEVTNRDLMHLCQAWTYDTAQWVGREIVISVEKFVPKEKSEMTAGYLWKIYPAPTEVEKV